MGMYSITGWSGGGRRPLTYNLKAGQFRGMGRVNVYPSKTTIVNNNFIGGGYGMYNNYECCNNSTPKWMNWMMGIGIGSTLLGGILSMFGIGGNNGSQQIEGAGGREPQTRQADTPAQDPTQTKEYKELNTKLDKALDEIAELKKQSQVYQEKQTAPSEEVEQKPAAEYSYIANGRKMVCTDASGRTQAISGTLSNVQTDAKGVPQSFTLTDDRSGNAYQYNVKVGSDGTLSYECTSKNGQATVGAPTYSLKDGKLVNENGQSGYGQGIRTQSAPPPTNQSSNDTTKIETTADGQSVSDVETFMTPYKHSDGKYYSKPEQNNELFNTPWSNLAASNNTQAKNASSVKTSLENCEAFKKAGGKDVKITQNSDGTFTATFKIQGGERTLSGAALDKFIEG